MAYPAVVDVHPQKSFRDRGQEPDACNPHHVHRPGYRGIRAADLASAEYGQEHALLRHLLGLECK